MVRSKSLRSKPKSITSAKKRAWSEFSRYVRLRDAIKTTGTTTTAKCVTCGKAYPAFGKGCLQAGHFIQGRNNAILCDERCVHAQCYNCNVNLGGRGADYFIFMEKEYGREVVDELIRLSHTVVPMKAFQWEEVELEFKSKYEELLTEREEYRHGT